MRTLYWNSDFRQVVPGIWLPWRLHRTICRRAHNATREHERENVVIEAAQTIVRMQVNSIPQDMFVLKPQPGMLMFDAERNATWQIPGGEHQVLDQVVRAALASVRVEAVTNREPIRDYLVAVGLVLLFAGALPLVPRLRRRRNHRPWLAG